MSRRARLTCQALEDRATPAYGLDPTFGARGRLVMNELAGFGPSIGRDVVVQPDGKLVALTQFGENTVGLVRLNPDGTPDASFGSGGLARLSAMSGYSTERSRALFLLPNGDVVVGVQRIDSTGEGGTAPGVEDCLIISTPASMPQVTTEMSTGPWTVDRVSVSSTADYTKTYVHRFLVTRIRPDGSVDTTYGTGGVAAIEFAHAGFSTGGMAVGPDGKVVAYASVQSDTGPDATEVARLNPDGSPDASFDGDGRLALPLPALTLPSPYGGPAVGLTDLLPTCVAVGPDGSVLFGATAVWTPHSPFPSRSAALVRLTPGGALDPTFDSDGFRVLGPTPTLGAFPLGTVLGVSVLPDGRAVALVRDGYGMLGDWVARFTQSGTPDPTFGGGDGLAPLPDALYSPWTTGLPVFTVAANGRVVVATQTNWHIGSYRPGEEVEYVWGDILVSALTPDGSEDVNFTRGDGAVTVPFDAVPGGHDAPYGVAVLPDGRVAVVGAAQVEPTPDTAYLGYSVGNPYLVRLAVAVFADDGVPVTPPAAPPQESASEEGGIPEVVGNDPEFRLPEETTGFTAAPPSENRVTAPEPERQVVRLAAGSGAPGSAPSLMVYNPDWSVRFVLDVFEPTFAGGVAVALADVNGDGVDDVIASAGDGGGPRVKVFDGKTGGVLADFFAFDESWRGGVSVAAGDFDGDGFADLAVGAAAGGGPRVRVYGGKSVAAGSPAVAADLFVLDDIDYRGGLTLAAADLDGDGRAELAVGAGPGVRVLDPAKLLRGRAVPVAEFAPFGAGHAAVGTDGADADGDGRPDLVAWGGDGSAARFSGDPLAELVPAHGAAVG